jgi:hypothetical protein
VRGSFPSFINTCNFYFGEVNENGSVSPLPNRFCCASHCLDSFSSSQNLKRLSTKGMFLEQSISKLDIKPNQGRNISIQKNRNCRAQQAYGFLDAFKFLELIYLVR